MSIISAPTMFAQASRLVSRAGFTVNAGLQGMSPSKTAAENQAALQASINIAQVLLGRVLIPAAFLAYAVGTAGAPGSGVTIGVEGETYCCEIVGESWNGVLGSSSGGAVNLVLADGANVSLITVASTAGPCKFANLNMWGSKDTQTGIVEGGSDKSYAVWFVDYAGGTRQRAADCDNVRIEAFASGGIRAGTWRSAGMIRGKCTILNCGRKESGVATAGAATTVTLAAGASAVDDFYNDMPIVLSLGTGIGQKRVITDYNGTTKVATVNAAWEINPANGTTYVIGLTIAHGLIIGSGFDWRVGGLDSGAHTGHGVYLTGAGAAGFTDECNAFANWGNGVQIDNTALDMKWFGGSIDQNFGYGVLATGSTGGKYVRAFHGTRFTANGRGRHNFYSDVLAASEDLLSVIGCMFEIGGSTTTNDRLPKNLIEASGTTAKINVVSPIYDTSGSNTPWATARFSHEAKIEGLVESGVYTPTYTNVGNVSARTTFDLRWSRNGRNVQFHGRVILTPTAAAPTQTIEAFSLPIASDFTAAHDLAGASACDGLNQSGVVRADVTNNRGELVFMAQDTTSRSQYFNGSYVLL